MPRKEVKVKFGLCVASQRQADQGSMLLKTCTEFEPYFGPHLPPPRLAPIRRAYPLFGIGGLKMVPRPAHSLSFWLAGQLCLRPPPVGRGRPIESEQHIATLIGCAYHAIEVSDVKKLCCLVKMQVQVSVIICDAA